MTDAASARAGEPRAGTADLDRKEAALYRSLEDLPSLIVAYSGGVDSAYLAYAATRVLGDSALCVTADSPSYPERHRQMADPPGPGSSGSGTSSSGPTRCRGPEYRANPANRCYYCKHELYTHSDRDRAASAASRPSPTAATPTTAATIVRAGRRPASSASSARSTSAGLTKDEIRELSRRAGLPTWDEPASACLSSRIPYFSEVTDEKLRMIERAEAVLRDLGFRDLPRPPSRHASRGWSSGEDEIARALEPDVAEAIDRELRALGYAHVTIDLRGYRLGSLNEALRLRPV